MAILIKSVSVFSRDFEKKSRFLSFICKFFGYELKSKCRYRAYFYVKSKEDMPCVNDILRPYKREGDSTWLVSEVDSKNLCFAAWSTPTFDTINYSWFYVKVCNCDS